MSSWSTFRRIRVGVFVLITVISLLLTIVYSLFLSSDFHHYNELQRVIVVASAVVNGITAIFMYLMLAVRFSTKWDAVRIACLLCSQAGSAAAFTLHSADFPCDAFRGGATCKQISSYTAIVSWALCGLLVVYGACLTIMAFVPRPPPIENLDPELDAEVPVNAQARRVTHMFINGHPSSNSRKQPYPSQSLLESHNSAAFVDEARIRQQMQRQREITQGYGAQFRPNVLPGSILRRDGSPPFQRIPSLDDESRPSPTSDTYADPIPRTWTQIPGSMHSTSRPSSPSVLLAGSAGSATLPPPPLPVQFTSVQRPASSRIRSSSLSNSVYSSSSADSSELPPPVPPFRQAHPMGQPIRSASTDSGHWKQLVLDAAGHGQGSF